MLARRVLARALRAGVGVRAASSLHASDELVVSAIRHLSLVPDTPPASLATAAWTPTAAELRLEIARAPSGLPMRATVDPFALVAGDLSTLSSSVRELVTTDHPLLSAAARYFFEQDSGKKFRATMVLLLSRACESTDDARVKQKRLAEIVEMIHTASLFHDDVIDSALTRRGLASANAKFGDKIAILAGDFLLARACVALARLRNLDVIELLSTVIEHLVRGEIVQMRPELGLKSADPAVALEAYLSKNFYKTGSLMANSCRAAAMLGGHDEPVCNAAFRYGRHVGLAFQLIDDVLDFEGSDASLGKPALADLRQGLVTAPTLLAASERPELIPLIARDFSAPGDVDLAIELVARSTGVARARALALSQAELAVAALEAFPDSEAREALVSLASKVVTRKH